MGVSLSCGALRAALCEACCDDGPAASLIVVLDGSIRGVDGRARGEPGELPSKMGSAALPELIPGSEVSQPRPLRWFAGPAG